MRNNMLACAALFLTALACERQAETPQPPAPAPAAEIAEAAAVDELEGFSDPVTGVAFWAHPALPFNGLTIVASGSSISAHNFEDGTEVSRIDAIQAAGVEVVYAGAGASATGYLTALDAGAGRFKFFQINNISRDFTEVGGSDATLPDANAFCIGRDPSGGHNLYTLGGDAMRTYAVRLGGDAVTLEPLGSAEAPDGAFACAVDGLDGAVFVAADEGDIYRYTEESGFGAQFVRTGISQPSALALALNGDENDRQTCCGQLAVLDRADASVHFFDREDGRALGAVRLTASFDVEGVEAATAMGLGYANFGGVYRDGVLALAVNGEKPALRLTPLNGVMEALGAPLGPAADPRSLGPQPAAEGLSFDVGPPVP